MKQSTWQRIILLLILACEGWGGVTGGILLVLAPNGRYMKIPVEIMHGFFPDFLIPGLILTGMGLLTTAAFIAVFLKNRFDWLLAGFAMYGFIIWFAAEIAIVREIVWLQVIWGVPVLVGALMVLPMVPHAHKKVHQTHALLSC